MRVFGIDPGTWRTGYGLLRVDGSVEAEEWGVISLPARTSLECRLFQIYSRLSEMLRRHHPDEVAVEEPFMGVGLLRYTGPAFAVAQAQAAAVMAAASCEIPVFRYAPAQVKLAVTDDGRASKEQVQELVSRQLGLVAPFPQSDAADALAIALCHEKRRRSDAILARQVQPGL